MKQRTEEFALNNDYQLYYSRVEEGQMVGVGLIVSKVLKRRVVSYKAVSSWIISILYSEIGGYNQQQIPPFSDCGHGGRKAILQGNAESFGWNKRKNENIVILKEWTAQIGNSQHIGMECRGIVGEK